MGAFFDTYDLLLCPATIVAAYPASERFVKECAGYTFSNYVEWLAIAYAITLTTSPALSLPCGFTGNGRPVGLQIVGPARAEGRVLAGARALELVLDLRSGTPIDPRSPG
jgi:amidase